MVHESPAIDYSGNNVYERDFSGSLLEFIKNDDLLKVFYDRFIWECENIIKVIMKLENAAKDVNASVKQLEKIVDKFVKAEKPKNLALLDAKFHIQLFQITEDKAFLEMSRQENSQQMDFLIWQSICRDTAHRDRLCKIHSEILEALKDKDKDKAISAMQEHFVVILIHYIRALKPK